jgi:penicillin-binding protein 1B
MNILRKITKKRKTLLAIAVAILAALSFYFVFLLKQVEIAFESPAEFIPTRIYSNVTRIAPPQPRAYIEKKLRLLGYTPKVAGQDLSIVLHSPTYPDYLLPENHITLKLKDKAITLHFDGDAPGSALESIRSDGNDVNEFYLEPEFIATLNSDKSQIREILKFEQFPKSIPDAVMAAEDQHFYEHFGIDPRGFLRAIFVDVKTLSLSQGGSTITQQLVKNLMERRNRNLFMKMNELFLAPVLEIKYNKKQIFERYLNEVFLGQIGSYEIRGFAEGAKYFFGKNVDDLNTGEIALMVGLIKGPAFYSPYRHLDRATTREKYVLDRMMETGKITKAQFDAALKQPIRLAQAPQAGNRAPYYVDFVKAELVRLLSDKFSAKEIEELGFQVYTTLDLEMNSIAQESLQKGINDLESRLNIAGVIQLQGALAAVDQNTGEIKTLIGGRNYAQSTFNRILNMKRQVGSTFKPIVYASAFRQMEDPNLNSFTPAYPLNDEAWGWQYDKSQPVWKPTNYEKENLGWISLKTALAKSINTTAARVAKRVGLANVADMAKTLGIETKIPEVPSVSLGSVELSPIEILEAYITFANHGKSDHPFVIKAIQNPDGSDFYKNEYRPKSKIDPGVADMMTYLLQDVFAEGTASGARAYGFDRPAAGKTGTTNDYRDSWFVGYTPQLTALVWVGLDQGVIQDALKEASKSESKDKPKSKKIPRKLRLTGAVAALPIWLDFMKQALQYEPALPFPESDHLVDVRLDSRSGQKAESSCPESQVVSEKVIVGREPKKSTCLSEYPKDID